MSVVRELYNRIAMLIARGSITRVQDAPPTQEVQATLFEGEIRDLARPQTYGLTSHPPEGTDVLAIFQGGDRSRGYVVAVMDPARPRNLIAGEVTIYTRFGQTIELKADGSIHVLSPTAVFIDAPAMKLGSVVMGVLEKLVTEVFVPLFNAHRHDLPGANSSETGIVKTQDQVSVTGDALPNPVTTEKTTAE